MFELELGKDNIKSLLTPRGIITLVGKAKDLAKPFDPQDGDLVSLTFDAGLDKQMDLGQRDTIKLGFKTETKAQLLLIRPNSPPQIQAQLEELGLEDYFAQGANADRILMLLTLDTGLDATAAATYVYSILNAGTTLTAGVNAGFSMAWPFPKSSPAGKALKGFFKDLSLPANISAAPPPGEVIDLELGGYLSFGAHLGLGYEMSGSPSINIKDLSLSENYKLSLLGGMSFQSKLAGAFHVQVRQGSKAGWARVKVTKSKQKDFSMAADVNMGVETKISGLPGSPNEFLEALLGLKAKNWLNLLASIKEHTDFKKLEEKLDTLAQNFIEDLTGQAFDKLENIALLNKAKDLFNKILDSYQNLDNYAISLFDRYYDPVAGKVDDALEKALQEIQSLTSLDQLKGKVLGEDLSDIIFWLTDGHPLDWLLGKIKIKGQSLESLEALKGRAENVLSLIKDKAHKEIRDLIVLAKSKFPLDKFLANAQQIDPEKLKAGVDKKITGFVERLIGDSIEDLSKSKLGKAVTQVHNALEKIDQFKDTVYEEIQNTMNQSLQFNLHMGYNRAEANDALIDVEINMGTKKGIALMKAAGAGDFSNLLSQYDPKVMNLHSGVFTHQVTRKSLVSFNILGWHKDFKYQKMTQLLTKSQQHIKSEANGMLTVATDITMELVKEKIKNDKRIYTNMMLAFIGSSWRTAEFVPATQRYLINSITSMSGTYRLMVEDKKTSPTELKEYLDFAGDLHIRPSGEQAYNEIAPTLSRDKKKNFGSVSLDYQVRFTQQGLQTLFTSAVTKIPIRRIIRKLTLAHYLDSGDAKLIDRAWCYYTDHIYQQWKNNPVGFSRKDTTLTPIAKSPFKNIMAPQDIFMKKESLFILNTLYSIEDNLVEGFEHLQETLHNENGLSPLEYEKSLAKLGKALQEYDSMDNYVNTFFAVFDALISATGQKAVRDSALTIKSKIPGESEKTHMLMP